MLLEKSPDASPTRIFRGLRTLTDVRQRLAGRSEMSIFRERIAKRPRSDFFNSIGQGVTTNPAAQRGTRNSARRAGAAPVARSGAALHALYDTLAHQLVADRLQTYCSGYGPRCAPTTTICLSVERIRSREEDGKYHHAHLGGNAEEMPLRRHFRLALSCSHTTADSSHSRIWRAVALHLRSDLSKDRTQPVSVILTPLRPAEGKCALNTSVSNTDTPTLRLAKALPPTTSTLGISCPGCANSKVKTFRPDSHGNHSGRSRRSDCERKYQEPAQRGRAAVRATPTHSPKSTPRSSWSLRSNPRRRRWQIRSSFGSRELDLILDRTQERRQ
jgi:hypothetical protein